MNTKSYKLGLALVAFFGLLFAFKTGNYIADEDYAPPAIAFGSLLFLAILFGLGNSIYILIPICWGLTDGIAALPLPFSVRQLAILISAIFFISGYVFKRKRAKAKFEVIDLFIAINLIYLVTVFVRNPVGFAAIGGGDRVGGKPYIDVILAVLAYLMLSRFRISALLSRKIPYWILGVSFFTSCVGAVATYLPEIALKLTPLYAGFSPYAVGGDFVAQVSADTGETRLGFLQFPGRNLVLLVVSRVNPSKLIGVTRLGSLMVYIAGFVMILLSGFRSGIIAALMFTALSLIIRERLVGFFKVIIFSIIILLSGMALSYSPIHLPFGVQRSLCFLPGNWDSDAVNDANNSSDWRFEMWRVVLTTDTYIQNRLLGDGFGFLRADYEKMIDIEQGIGEGYGGDNAQQEAFMLNGDFHSGPIGAIRFVGYVGLILFLPLIFYTSLYAYRLIQKTRGTPFEFLAYFISIPIILNPLIFIFIVGDYRQDLVDILFNVGMIKMISGSLDEYNKSRLYVPPAPQAQVRRPMQLARRLPS